MILNSPNMSSQKIQTTKLRHSNSIDIQKMIDIEDGVCIDDGKKMRNILNKNTAEIPSPSVISKNKSTGSGVNNFKTPVKVLNEIQIWDFNNQKAEEIM